MSILKPILMTGVVLAFCANLAACNKSGAEKAGENLDSAVEEATQGEKKLNDGPLENAGEAIEGKKAQDNL
jgi:hypothetical protein